MNLRPVSSKPGAPQWGSLALVTYLPEPLSSFLTELRQFLPGETQEAHITFLPPRQLSLPIQVAASEIQSILQAVKPFELELGSVKLFPETNVLYLDLEGGRRELLALHDLLNQGELFAEENFEYIPHLTLGGPLAASDVHSRMHQAERAWKDSGLSPRFVVEEVVLLWQPGSCLEGDWTRISAHPLQSLPSASTATEALATQT